MQHARQKTLLVIAYYFPPLGMGGVQRVSKFVKYLPEFDWVPAVVTVKSIAYYATDPSLLDDLGRPRVLRTGSLDPQRLLFLLGKRGTSTGKKGIFSHWQWRCYDLLSRWIFIPDSKVLWLPFALYGALRVLSKGEGKLLYTTSPPHSAHFLGLALKIACRRPWAADFRDQWTGGHLDRSPTSLHRVCNTLLEKVVLRFADVVVTVTPGLERSFRAKSPGSAAQGKFITITNGYDAADFSVPAHTEVQMRGRNIVYCGSVSRLANPELFLMALRMLVQEKSEYEGALQVIIVGEAVGIDLTAIIETLELGRMVEITGYVPHSQAIAYLRGASILLMLLTDTKSDDVIPGKAFEYIGAGKPIFAIGPEGDLAELIRSTGRGMVLPQSSTPREIANALDRMLSNGGVALSSEHSQQSASRFERRVLTARLAGVLDGLLFKKRRA